ncbi:MAG: hypothetical protein JWL61_2307 [Gemmatimonadetes bacterium]|nr:hypothetical protein [Gemmatimonadota bacterium]
MTGKDEAIGKWRVKCAAAKFDRWRADPSFSAVLTLGRIVNALSFAGYAMRPVQDTDTPAAFRQRLNAFMYIGATLFEAVEFLDRVRTDLHPYSSATRELFPLIDEPAMRELLAKRLKPLRNRAVFHFDSTFVPKTPGAEIDGDYVFLNGLSDKSGEAYYDLADRSVMNTIIGVGPTHEEFDARSRALMIQASSMMRRFIGAANDVIHEALDHPDWEVERMDDEGESQPPSE